DLLFYLSFDSEMKADVSKGAAEPDKLKGSGATEGLSGRGVRFNREEGVAECAFPAKGCIDPAQGTVALHFRPNWSGEDYAIRNLFSWPGPANKSGGANAAGSLTLYTFRYKQPLQELWFWLDDSGGGNNTAKTCIAEWKKGEWHHLAATWDARYIQIYIDGKLKARKRVKGAIGTPGERFYVGSGLRGRNNADGVMDNFCIFHRVLTASEIGLLTGRKEFTTPHIYSLALKQTIFYTSERYVPFTCEAGGKVSRDTHELAIALVSEEGKTAAKTKEPIGKAVYTLQAEAPEEGDYTLRVSLRECETGKVVDTKEAGVRFIDGPFTARQ
ncbi:MAG: LamG domain-containing protein, partial [Planctomycetes bacterium]|nr:LamG domain-containing protein [Planctomycetota bacterium]